MKVMVVGQGGREHALVKSLARSPSVSEIHAVPGNDGMSKEALCHPLSWKDTEELIQLCLRTEIDFVFIGPEDPLVDGLADQLRDRGILVVGPGREAALLEGSKVFAKNFMRDAGVPTAPFAVVKSVADVQKEISGFTPPYVLKADGLAAGKGVYICKTESELLERSRDLFENRILGEAGNQALLEQFQPGWELSYLVLTNGREWRTLPLAQDHKRLKDFDEGPNTGGMGTVAPLEISDELRNRIETEIVAPSIQTLSKKSFVFRGVLFIGVMVTESGPKVLEYNTRFGDPETQVILPLLEGDCGKLFSELARGKLLPVHTKK
ncbi:MAG TPA: phosphoribosylamine--glycine ligase, partial [Pseudobdellovibrionaceae bacterium]|nr:phosphoribosylamine--glycine ligase [Pseudobdellovibrionaceae bacterium]